MAASKLSGEKTKFSPQSIKSYGTYRRLDAVNKEYKSLEVIKFHVNVCVVVLLLCIIAISATLGYGVPRLQTKLERAERANAAFIASRNCGTRSQTRIVGGSSADPMEWPWQAAVLTGTTFCGGSYIGGPWILTAGHCANGIAAGDLSVALGVNDFSKASHRYSVESITVHPKFNMQKITNDLALLKLKEVPRISDSIRPVCLPAKGDDHRAADEAWVTGWGATEPGGGVTYQLQEVKVNLLDNSQCSTAYGRSFRAGTEICAGYTTGGKDSCQGDSGGPLVVNRGAAWTQIGIVSWGGTCAAPNQPGVYTKLDMYTDWIRQETGLY